MQDKREPSSRENKPYRVSPDAIAELLAVARERSASRVGASGGSIARPILLLSRLLSTVLAGIYFYLGNSVGVHPVRVTLFLVIPLAVAWFPEAMARATGRLDLGTVIRRPSSPRLVLFMGWVLLLAPLWIRGILGLIDAA